MPTQRPSAWHPACPPGSGTLTAKEIEEIQAIADKYGTTIDVVGSRAAGKGRNIDTNFPKGKYPKETTRSDIDFKVDGNHPQIEEIMRELRGVGNGVGSAERKYDIRNTRPPSIRFEPTQCGS